MGGKCVSASIFGVAWPNSSGERSHFLFQAFSLECYIASCHLPFLNCKNLATGLSKNSTPHCFPQVQKFWIVSFLCDWWWGGKNWIQVKIFHPGRMNNSNYSWSWIIRRVKSKLGINLGWNYFNLMFTLTITYTLYKTWCFNFFLLGQFYVKFLYFVFRTMLPRVAVTVEM